jgi:thymidylate synthase
MKKIETETIGEAWVKACGFIMKEGFETKDDDEKLKEILHIFIKVKKPGKDDEIIDNYGDKNMISWMNSNFLEQKIVQELKNSLSYGTRLFNYEGKNQIQWVIEKLKNKIECKSATIPTLMPNKDSGYIPCICLLDFKIRENKLILTVFCRSIDFGNKAYANMIALNIIQKMVADELKILPGDLVFEIVSGHIYEKNFDQIKLLLKQIKNNGGGLT